MRDNGLLSDGQCKYLNEVDELCVVVNVDRG